MVLKRWLTAFAATALLAACSSSDDGPRHAELQPITTTVEGRIEWQTRVGQGIQKHYSRLRPAVQDDKVFVADRHGAIAALNVADGREIWRNEIGGRRGILNRWFKGEPARISGLTVAGPLLFVGTENGKVFAFNNETGELEWEQSVPGEVLAAPAVGDGRVVVHLGNGRVVSMSARSGEIQWQHEDDVSLLSLRGTSQPVISSGGVMFGGSTGKAVVLISQTGQLAWEERIATPTGSTELERIVDADGTPLVVGGTMYLSAQNGELVALDLRTGEALWKRDYGAWRSPIQAQNRIVLVDQQSNLISVDRNNGLEQWRNTDLYLRSVTEPATLGSYLVAADRFGYVHWFDRSNGQLVGRLELNGDAVRSAPVLAGERIIVQDAAGRIYSVRQSER